MMAKYNRTLEQLMGKKDLERNRKPILNTIRKGKFEVFIVKLLNKSMPFTLEGIDKSLPIRHDIDALSQ